jgi:hypothetical protein
MDANFDIIAKELYGKIQTRFPSIKIGDENGAVLSKKEDIPQARFFEFKYSEGGNPLATITMTLDNEEGLVIKIMGDFTPDGQPSNGHRKAYKWVRSFRDFARSNTMKFDVQTSGQSNLDKRDYDFLAKRPEETGEGNMMESKLFGTSKVSYQDLGEARLIIRHSQPVNPELAAGRTLHIESIYIESALGERFLYPTKHLNGARALAEHIKNGGTPYDSIGKHVIGLSEELASLRRFKGYVNRQDQLSETMGHLTDRVVERIDQIKETIHKLQRPAYYKQFIESFEEQEEKIIPEDVINDLVDRLTIRTFNEELKTVFPYIFKLTDGLELPIKELSADDLLTDAYNPNSVDAQHRREMQANHEANIRKKAETGDPDAVKRLELMLKHKERRRNDYDARMERESYSAEEIALEEFMDAIVNEEEDTPNKLFSDDEQVQKQAIKDLNDIFSKGELMAGGEGINVISTVKGLIDDPDFIDELKQIDSELDARPVIQALLINYDENNGTTIAQQLDFNGDADSNQNAEPVEPPAPAEAPPAAAPAPAEAPAAAPAQPAPVAEGDDNSPPWDTDDDAPKFKKPSGNPRDRVQALRNRGIQAAIARAKEAGAKLDTRLNIGGRQMTLHDAIEECGMTPMECGFDSNGSDFAAMKEFMSGFVNREERNITIGNQKMKDKLKKQFPGADTRDLEQIYALVDKIDPPSELRQQNDIIRLSGVRSQEVDEMSSDMDIDAMFNDLMKQSGATTTSTSSGTINGQPASYGDAMSKANGMKMRLPKFGDGDEGDEVLDFSNPDAIGQTLQKKVGGMMKGVQGQVPNQNIQFPGGQMNPADMMKQIMGKINFGK